MNLQQLRYVQATVKFNLNLTEAANALYTSQPGVSKQIRDFEEELGVEIFERKGKRLTCITEPGKEVVNIIDRIVVELENLRKVADHFSMKDQGHFILATTHTQARYALPPAIQKFKEIYPKVHLALHQASPTHIVKMLIDGDADLGIATEALENHPELISFPCYEWSHILIFPKGHPLEKVNEIDFNELAKYPLITYEPGFTGGSHIDEAFKKNNVSADIVLTAMDADVIKTYVELGMGVGIVASMAFNVDRDANLVSREAKHLFGVNVTRLAIRKSSYLRDFILQFIAIFSPHLTADVVKKAFNGESVV